MDIKSTSEVKKTTFLAPWGGSKKTIERNETWQLIHSLKVGLALTLLTLLYYLGPLQEGFGVLGMLSSLIVTGVFEYTVGETLIKCLNIGCSTLLAGALGVGYRYWTTYFGEKGHFIVFGILVFILGAGTTFLRIFSKIKEKIDDSLVIFVVTFTLFVFPRESPEETFSLTCQRLVPILIGIELCMVISVLFSPVWASEELKKLIASNIEQLADYLEGFEGKHLHDQDDREILEIEGGYERAFNSVGQEESLANFAGWEQSFVGFRHSDAYEQYLKIGALVRECAYKIGTLDNDLNSEIKAYLEFKLGVKTSCMKICYESNKALKELSSSIKTMTDSSAAKIHIENSKVAVEELSSELETIALEEVKLRFFIALTTTATKLGEITKTVEQIDDVVCEISHFKSVLCGFLCN